MALEKEVDATSKRVAQLRVDLQSQIQEKLEEKLAKSRPNADVRIRQGEEKEGEVGNEVLSPAAEDLRARLEGAAGRIPELAARLAEAQNRLMKVLDASASGGPGGGGVGMSLSHQQQQRDERLPPNTIERAVLGVADDDEDDEDEEHGEPMVSPALALAVESGQVTTRRGHLPDGDTAPDVPPFELK